MMATQAGVPAPGSYDVVIPTSGRPSLRETLHGLARGDGPLPWRVIVVDDRRRRSRPLTHAASPKALAGLVEVVEGRGRGPAAARNTGWRAATADWVAFLDDDVMPGPGWREKLHDDLHRGSRVGASQGRVRVPLPTDRAPTDWERNVAGLEHARWATADMAYRRDVLQAVGGFDERFPRAYREDADLGLRVTAAGWEIVGGDREVLHPVRRAPARVSLDKQSGNADDVLMRALHGPDWRERSGAPPGRRPRHVAVAAAAGIGLVGAWARRRTVVIAAGAVWAAGTAEFAWARIAPGPRTPAEVATLAWTSAAIPFAATGWWLYGLATLRRRLHDGRRAPHGTTARLGGDGIPAAVLFDRDGTLVVDVPYNGDPERVELVPTARAALEKLRLAGIPTGVVSNQSGIARGLLTEEQVRAVNARIEELLGPLGQWSWCPHGPADGCACRKPRPGLILAAARRLGVDVDRVTVIGDIGADVEAAHAAGARAVMVPTPRTRPEEIAAAPLVAPDLEAAVDVLLRPSA